MKILFSSRPAFGHVYPMMPLALAARRAGHDVRFATAGDFVDELTTAGFPTFPVGPTVDEAQAELLAAIQADGMPKQADGRPDLALGGRLFIDIMGQRVARELGPVLDRVRPDVVVYEQGEFGAAVAAHARGIPAVMHSISPGLPDEARAIVAGDGRVERLWASQGVTDPALDVFRGDVLVDIFPSAMQRADVVADPARQPLRPAPYAREGVGAPAWLDEADRPVVYVTLGTIVATDLVLAPVIDALAPLDAEILVALGSAEGRTLGARPANVHVEGFVDQGAVLARAALAVHHGGSGTILAALTAGVPQLLLPQGTDQFLNADLLRATGIAPALDPDDATATAIADLAAAALAAGQPPAAVAARAELAAMPDADAVVDTLVTRLTTRPAA